MNAWTGPLLACLRPPDPASCRGSIAYTPHNILWPRSAHSSRRRSSTLPASRDRWCPPTSWTHESWGRAMCEFCRFMCRRAAHTPASVLLTKRCICACGARHRSSARMLPPQNARARWRQTRTSQILWWNTSLVWPCCWNSSFASAVSWWASDSQYRRSECGRVSPGPWLDENRESISSSTCRD